MKRPSDLSKPPTDIDASPKPDFHRDILICFRKNVFGMAQGAILGFSTQKTFSWKKFPFAVNLNCGFGNKGIT